MVESLLRRMGCEMVSNAALRSRRMRMEMERVSCNEEIVGDFDEGGLCAVMGAETRLERLVE